MKTFFVDNHGCAKNQVDAEEMASRLEAAGYARSASADGADLIVVNTCGFIDEAKKESIGAVMAARSAHPDSRILVAGCLSQRYADALGDELPEADGVFGNGDLSLTVQAAEAALKRDRTPIVPERGAYAPARRGELFGFPRQAYLKIAEGCSNHCSFCAIPLIRGEVSSRPPEDVAAELADLIRGGAWEVSLIGQDLGSYGLDLAGRPLLPDLLSMASSISGDFRVRMLYIHPDRFPRGAVDACAKDGRILPYFDLPVQHASTRVLRAMNRAGDSDAYLELFSGIRSALPGAVIRSTFLVGFPGEDDADFKALREFQEKARLDWAGAFAYSREEGTPAWSLGKRPSSKLAKARKAELEAAQAAITERALGRFVGTVQTVLVEERIDGEELAIARGYMNAPEVDGAVVVVGGELAPGDVVETAIRSVKGVDLEAVLRA